MNPIELYTYQTPNGHKASIMLEETGLPYRVHVIDIEAGDQHRPDFLTLNPNNKIPVIVDPDRQRTVFESGAILFYLADRTGVLQPRTDDEQLTTLQWTLFQAAHVGPTLGQLWNFKIFATEKMPPVIARFERETQRVLGVLDRTLAQRAYLVGDYGIADVMTWPWVHAAVAKIDVPIDAFSHLSRWYADIGQRPAVRRGLEVPRLAHEHAA